LQRIRLDNTQGYGDFCHFIASDTRAINEWLLVLCKYLFLQPIASRSFIEKDPEGAALVTNHHEFYVKTFRRGMQWIRQVTIQHANVQKVKLKVALHAVAEKAGSFRFHTLFLQHSI
jgi:hypothetical protein